MISTQTRSLFFLVVLCAINLVTFSQTEAKKFVVTKQNQTIYFSDISVNKYYMNVKCTDKNGEKIKYKATDLIKVQIGNDEYHSGRVTTAAIGGKEWRLMKLRPGSVENPEVSVYYYTYDTSIDGYTTTGTDTAFAFRNTNSIREDFKKIVWPVWQNL